MGRNSSLPVAPFFSRHDSEGEGGFSNQFLNILLDNMWLFWNFFFCGEKLCEKMFFFQAAFSPMKKAEQDCGSEVRSLEVGYSFEKKGKLCQ